MKTDSQKTNKSIWLSAAIGWALLILFAQPQTVSAQQWTTNGNDISNTNSGNVGVGLTTPLYKFDVLSGTGIIARFGSTAAANNQVLFNAPSGYNTNLTLQHAGVSKWYLGNRAANDRFSFIESTGALEVFSILQNGNIGIGTTSPYTRLTTIGVSGEPTLTHNTAAIASFLGASAGNELVVGASSNSPYSIWLQNRNFYMDGGAYPISLNPLGGNVGIGTTSPTAILHIQGSGTSSYRGIQVQNSFTDATDKGAIAIIGARKTNANVPFSGFGTWDQGTFRSVYIGGGQWSIPDATVIKFYTASTYDESNGVSGNLRMLIDSSGNVGIGTATPGGKLDISQNGAAPALLVQSSAAGDGARLDLRSTDSGGITWRIGSLGNVGGRVGNFEIQDTAQGTVNIAIQKTTGNVGIGLMTPGYKLDVNGTVNATGLNINGSPVTSSQWNTSGSTINYTAGNIGIGATSPQSKLSINTSTQSPGSMLEINNRGDLAVGSWSAIRFGLDSNSYPNQYAKGGIIYESRDQNNRGKLHLVVNTAANTANMSLSDALLTVDGTTGNVGIGSTTPASKLDVAGNINASGTVNAVGGLNINGSPVTSSQWTTSGSNINYAPAGFVGIGVPSPGSKLDVAGNINATGTINAVSGLNINGSPVTSSQWTTSGSNISYTVSNGNVGIGGTPTTKLHVFGDGRVTGNLTVDGNIAAKYQDMAEWVPSSEQLPSGTVVVLDSTKSNQVISSTQPYDTRVAGVISEQPGIALGESGAGKVLVATTGRVLVNVDASRGPIHIADLLVTSDVPGVAMKSEPVNLGGVQLHRPGTLIGKALEPLEKGSGKILVLLSLQ